MTTISEAIVNGYKRLNKKLNDAYDQVGATQEVESPPLKLACNLCDSDATHEAFSPDEDTLHYFLCSNFRCWEKVKRLGWAIQFEPLK